MVHFPVMAHANSGGFASGLKLPLPWLPCHFLSMRPNLRPRSKKRPECKGAPGDPR